MIAKRIILYTFLILALAAGFFWRAELENYFLRSSEIFAQFTSDSLNGLLENAQREISAPEPLKSEREEPGRDLTASGIARFTNAERQKSGLPSLAENKKLNEAALAKAQDMLTRQYFAHESPDGEGPQDLAENAKYDFLIIGENLALGNFAGDADLVAAWMASPGHRENILGKKYSEIGVAVAKGIFEDKETWMAVQEFGTPSSACPTVDDELRKKAEANKEETRNIAARLDALRKSLKNVKTETEYLRIIEEYNTLVSRHNSLMEKTKEIIDNYNRQVKIRNGCLANFGE